MPLVAMFRLSSTLSACSTDRPFHSTTAFDGVHAERTVALGENRDHHVFQHAQIAKDFGRLEHAGNAHLVDLVGFAPQHRLAVEHDRAGVGDELADEAVEQGRLARPVGADDRVDAVFLDAEVHVVPGPADRRSAC